MLPRRAYQEAQDPTTPPTRLAALAAHKKLVLRRRLAHNSATPSKTLEEILYPRDWVVWKGLAKNPSIPARVLVTVGCFFPEDILENPALPLLLLETPTLLQNAWLFRSLLGATNVSPQYIQIGATHPDSSFRKAIAQNPSTPKELLERLAFDIDQGVRIAAKENPKTPGEVFEWMKRLQSLPLSPGDLERAMSEEHLRCLLAQNPNLPEEQVRALFQDPSLKVRLSVLQRSELPEEIFASSLSLSSAPLVLALAAHPKMPASVLEGLFSLRRSDPTLLNNIARNPNTPAPVLERMVERVYAVVDNPSAPEHLIQKLLQHNEAWVRMKAARHPNAPKWLLDLYRRVGYDPIRDTYQRPAPKLSEEDQSTLLKLSHFCNALFLKNPHTKEEILRSYLGDKSLKLAVCSNPGLSLSLLEELSSEQDNLVRRAIFQNPATPPRLLYTLFNYIAPFYYFAGSIKPKGPDEVFSALSKVYHIEARCIAARNQHLPEALREAFARDRYIPVRAAVAERLDLSSASLKILLQDRSAKVRAQAAVHPNAPKAFLSLLRRAGASEDLSQFAPPDVEVSVEEVRRLSLGGYFAKLLAARHPRTPPEALQKLSLTEPSIAVYVMCHPNTSEETLRRIAKRKFRVLHQAMLKRPTLSSEVLWLFLGGLDRSLRTQAARRPEAKELCQLFIRAGASEDLSGFGEPDLSLDAQTLSRFAAGGLYAQQLAARHPNTPPHLLEGFALSLRSYIRGPAAQNPSTPQGLLQKLRRCGASVDLLELEAPDEDVTAKDFLEVERLGPFGALLSSVMQPLLT